MIEEIIPGNKTRLNIIKTIYENPGINLTRLIKIVKASPNLVLDYINKLIQYKIVKEEKSGTKKKTHIRKLSADLSNETAELIYSLVEIDKTALFFKKYSKLKPFFIQLEDIIKEKGFTIIYGSYARLSATKESDLDLLIVGQLKNEEIKKIKEIFATLETELSLKIENKNSFLKNINKPLYKNLLKQHIIINGTINFMRILKKKKG